MGHCKDEDCGEATCCKHECCGDKEDMPAMMFKLAEEAWGELMKEKMKAVLEKNSGETMNKVAAASVEAASAFHMGEMKSRADMEANKQKIMNAFGK